MEATLWINVAAAVAGGYLVGSIPFGLLLTRIAGLGDVRSIGSGNIGATNVLRTGKKGLAAITLLLDFAKGLVAVLYFEFWWPSFGILAGAGAVLGHMFPIWLRFRGGKGVATAGGVLLGVSWLSGVLAVVTWLLVARVSRYSSLAALVATAAAPVYVLIFGETREAVIIGAVVALVWLRHRENIIRLLEGSESKINIRSRETES